MSLQHDYYQLSREKARYDTYGSDMTVFNDLKDNLVKAGFYYTKIKQTVKCFCCFIEFDIDDSFFSPSTDFVRYHKQVNPDCLFINGDMNNTFDDDDVEKHSKKFLSYNCLYYEKERLATFIEWPLPYILPRDLAANGFYYLRSHDHCACVFCRGIVGAWEIGDTPQGEHRRHFSFCPFIRGLTSGNVPIEHSQILEGLTLDGEECPIPTLETKNFTFNTPAAAATAPDTDVCGRRRTSEKGTSENKNPGNNNNNNNIKKVTQEENITLSDLGLTRYSGPSRKDYITEESRLKSFYNNNKEWPERLVQKPEELAAAGFFYCGLSDHVRCFYCGNGLHNWESNDIPWVEHARWYPECHFVIMFKGEDFINQIRREKPLKKMKSSGHFKSISDSDLEILMKSTITTTAIDMGFDRHIVVLALRERLKLKGMPFFNLESCIAYVIYIEAKLEEEEEAKRREEEERGDDDGVHEEEGRGSNDDDDDNVFTEEIIHEEEEEGRGREDNDVFTEEVGEEIVHDDTEDDGDDDMLPQINNEEVIIVPDSSRRCRICMDLEIEIVFLPCCHMVTCNKCSLTMSQCPICRMDIKYIVKPIVS